MENETVLNRVDRQLISSLFNMKASSMEHLELVTGTMSTQLTIIGLKDDLISYLTEYKNKNGVFYIFVGDVEENNLKLVVHTTTEINERTRRFVISIKDDWTSFEISQMSENSKILLVIKVFKR
jgi:hypothetical protein